MLGCSYSHNNVCVVFPGIISGISIVVLTILVGFLALFSYCMYKYKYRLRRQIKPIPELNS